MARFDRISKRISRVSSLEAERAVPIQFLYITINRFNMYYVISRDVCTTQAAKRKRRQKLYAEYVCCDNMVGRQCPGDVEP
jgi:hypothetical protein